MKTYVTFGFDHRHIVDGKVIDKDCVAVISCADAAEGRKIAFELFGHKFSLEYPEDHFDFDSMRDFPRGFIEVNDMTSEHSESETDIIFRCVWCGFPCNEDGSNLLIDNDEADAYLKKNKKAEVSMVEGNCCLD